MAITPNNIYFFISYGIWFIACSLMAKWYLWPAMAGRDPKRIARKARERRLADPRCRDAGWERLGTISFHGCMVLNDEELDAHRTVRESPHPRLVMESRDASH
jgi:hypothetical protein